MFFLTNPIEITAYTSFLLVWAVNLFRVCYPNALSKEMKKKSDKSDCGKGAQAEKPGISVVILTQNQEEQLMTLLPRVLEQAYDSFEIIVVDMNSTDNTRIQLENMEKRYDNLKYTFVPKDTRQISLHTLALILGVKAAHYSWVMLLTPDFLPHSEHWLACMSDKMTEGKDFVLGARSVNAESSSIRSFYYLLEQSRFLSWSLHHQTSHCNHVNLAFRKEKLLSCKTLGEYGVLLSGVENIFVNRFSTNERTAVCIAPEALLQEISKMENKDWKKEMLYQKETKCFYKHKSQYGLYSAFRMGIIWLLFLLGVSTLTLSIWTRHWEYTAGIVVLLVLWSCLRTRKLKKLSALFSIKTAGIYLPFYELRLSCIYWGNSIRYAFQDKKVFYRKLTR